MRLHRLGEVFRPVPRRAGVAGACLTAVLLVATATSARGQPCPCPQRDLATIVRQADLIFAGKPLAATTDSARVGARPAVETQVRFAFDVAAVLKGTTTRATTVVTPVGPCGASFSVGGDYLVLARTGPGGIVTDACQGNVAGAEAIRSRAAAIRAELEPKRSSPHPTAAP